MEATDHNNNTSLNSSDNDMSSPCHSFPYLTATPDVSYSCDNDSINSGVDFTQLSVPEVDCSQVDEALLFTPDTSLAKFAREERIRNKFNNAESTLPSLLCLDDSMEYISVGFGDITTELMPPVTSTASPSPVKELSGEMQTEALFSAYSPIHFVSESINPVKIVIYSDNQENISSPLYDTEPGRCNLGFDDSCGTVVEEKKQGVGAYTTSTSSFFTETYPGCPVNATQLEFIGGVDVLSDIYAGVKDYTFPGLKITDNNRKMFISSPPKTAVSIAASSGDDCEPDMEQEEECDHPDFDNFINFYDPFSNEGSTSPSFITDSYQGYPDDAMLNTPSDDPVIRLKQTLAKSNPNYRLAGRGIDSAQKRLYRHISADDVTIYKQQIDNSLVSSVSSVSSQHRDLLLQQSLRSVSMQSNKISKKKSKNKKSSVKLVTRFLKMFGCSKGRPSLTSNMSTKNCAVGYKRANVTAGPYLGVCVPCECNGHSGVCDPDTGECLDCQHNTAGSNCEVCTDGFYGDATTGRPDDCSACPCLEPRVVNATCNVTAEGFPVCLYCAEGYTGNLCDSCDTFYYGNPEVPTFGQCTQCDCNGNSDQCDIRTGQCVNCSNNATGLNCERCQDNWFGNATAQTCRECGCDLNGSDSSVCNYTTGQCPCFPGVGIMTCDQCLPNYYGYANETIHGCASCDCNPGGSNNLQCNNLGKCTCNDISGGEKCDFCAEGYYGLPIKACELCECNVIGTVDVAVPCELVYGQCECKPGVVSRQCDQCDRLYTGFSDTGCTACDVCQTSLGNDTLVMKERWTQYWNQSLEVAAVQQQDSILQDLHLEINQTSSLLGISSNTLDVLTATVATLNTQERFYNNSVQIFLDRVLSLQVNSELRSNESTEEIARIEQLQILVNNASAAVTALNTTSQRSVQLLSEYVTQAQALLSASLNVRVNEVNVSFTSELEMALLELTRTLTTTARAEAVSTQVSAQNLAIQQLRTATEKAQSDFQNIATPLEEIVRSTQALRDILTQTWININLTQDNLAYIETLLNETDTLLSLSGSILAESQLRYSVGQQVFQDAKRIIEGDGDISHLLPENSTVDVTRVPSFNQGADYLDVVELPPLSLALSSLNTSDVPRLTTYVQGLTQQAQAIDRAFRTVEPKGQQAVDAINTYESVISSLTVARELALVANRTMQEALVELQSVSVENLQQQAQNMVATAASLMANASLYDNTATVLRNQLILANNTLNSAINTWRGLSTRISGVNEAATNLSEMANDPTIPNAINAGLLAADNAISRADAQSTQAAGLESAVSVQEGKLTLIQETVQNATLLQAQIGSDLLAFTPQLNSIQTTVSQANSTYISARSIRNSIDARILQVEEKVRRAKELLARMEQPVSFKAGAFEQISNPRVATPNLLFNEIAFEFKYDLDPVGILFFAENNATDEKLLIQMTGEELVFEYSNVDTTMKAVSPVTLCRGCWFRVIATRYAIEIKLTVIKKSAGAGQGGSAVTHVRGDSTLHNFLTLTSPLFVAGLPTGYQLTKVYPSDVQFEGCIYQLMFDGFTVPLWQNILHQDSRAQCCSPPPDLPQPPTIQAVSFDGFGSYVKADLPSLPITTSSHISLQLRTFSSEGVVFIVDAIGMVTYYGLFLQGGKLALAANDGATSVILRTDQSYDDGVWSRVTVQFNQTYALLHVEQQDVNNTAEWLTKEVKSIAHTANLAALVAAQYTFGGQNPDTPNFGPVSRSFAGCIQDLQHNTDSTVLTLSPVALETVITASSGVNNNTCYQQVVSGIGIDSNQGYAVLNNILNPIRLLSFDVLTYEPNGILVYAELSGNVPGTFLYIALYNGDIIVLFDQGSGVQPILGSRDLFIADGLAHTIFLDFSFQNSPRLSVSGQKHYGALTMRAGMPLRDDQIYVGGVPSNILLDRTILPVVTSLVGGISNIRVNDGSVDYMASVDPSKHHDAYLGEIPAGPDSPPAPPYPTLPPGPSTVAPTCAPSSLFSTSTVGVRFGTEPVSFMSFGVNNLIMFNNSFVVRVEFRAVQPSGIILYMSSTATRPSSPASPFYYLCLYLENGYLKLSLQTSTGPKKTASKFRYNDGEWWKVDVLRLNDFVALIVPGSRPDYNNNGIDSAVSTALLINSPIYVGGVSEQHSGAHFNDPNEIGIGTASFHGCIKSVEFIDRFDQILNLNLNTPQDTQGVSACYEQVHPGVFLNSTTAYIRVESDSTRVFSIVPGFELFIEFRSSIVDGTLVVAYQSQSRFFLIDMLDGQICILIGNTQLAIAPLIAKSSTLDVGYGLCNGDLHNLTVRIEQDRLLFNFDSYGWEVVTYPDNFSPPSITNIPLHVGGIKEPGWTFPLPAHATSRASFHGCLQTFRVNSQSYNLMASSDKRAVIAGCPA